MYKLSVLLFSKDDIRNVLIAIKSVYKSADEIVLIDSSNKRNRSSLQQKKVALGLTKLKIKYLPPLGYVEPYRMFGLKSCKYKWVLYLDADERINNQLAVDLKQIINKKEDGFLINRILYDENGSIKSRVDYQLRLYKKSRIKYSGMLHEIPNLNGRVRRLSLKYWIEHHHSSEPDQIKKFITRYLPIEMITGRMSYAIMLRNAAKSHASPALKCYVKLKLYLRHMELSDELTKFDYKLFALLQLLAYAKSNLAINKILDFSDMVKNYHANNYKVNKFFEVPMKERKLQFEISKEIDDAGGLIRYLELDNKKTVDKITKRYSKLRVYRISLTEDLIRHRYLTGKNA